NCSIHWVEDGGVEPQPRLVQPCSRRRSRHREIIFQSEGAGVEPGRFHATRFSGPVSAPRRPHLPAGPHRMRSRYSRRGSNPLLRLERAPSSAIGPREHGASGWTRTSSPSFGHSGHVHVRRRSVGTLGGTRTRSLRVRSAAQLLCYLEGAARYTTGRLTVRSASILSIEPGASGRSRTCVPRFADARLATWPPMRRSGARIRTLISGVKGQRPTVERHLIEVERTGIEPAAAALQVQLAPMVHASPADPAAQSGPDEDRTRLSRSTAAHPHQRISGPWVCEGNRTLFYESH